jgi:hypothetical protein
MLVSDLPPAPKIGARLGQMVLTASFSPVLNDGLIVAGDQLTSQSLSCLTIRTVVAVVQAPTCGSANRSLTCALAESADFAIVIGPAPNDAWEIPSALNAWEFTEVKSAGGLSTSERIAAQSPRPQSSR